MIIEILLLYVVYLALLILTSYYINLYISKDQFTKDELKDILPYLARFKVAITAKYTTFLFVIILSTSSLIGLIIPFLSNNWFLNSSIIFIITYFTFPLVKKNFDNAKVTTGGNFSDTIINIFAGYYNIIIIGFGAGTATAIMYNWGANKAIHFVWLMINFIIISILSGIEIKNTGE